MAINIVKYGNSTLIDLTPTTATASDVASGKVFFDRAGVQTTGTASGGGGGIGTLLNTTSIGTISTSSTTAADTGKTATISNVGNYDLLIVEVSVNTLTNNRHASTVNTIWLTASSTIGTKNGTGIATATLNTKLSSTGVASTRQGTTKYGIYVNSASVSNNTVTLAFYQRYNSTSTGTINGTYTARTYGVNLYDLIGG